MLLFDKGLLSHRHQDSLSVTVESWTYSLAAQPHSGWLYFISLTLLPQNACLSPFSKS